jgi:hypothetical protein
MRLIGTLWGDNTANIPFKITMVKDCQYAIITGYMLKTSEEIIINTIHSSGSKRKSFSTTDFNSPDPFCYKRWSIDRFTGDAYDPTAYQANNVADYTPL